MNNIIQEISDELDRATKQHPNYPKDIIHQVSIMNEEAGESIRAALNYYYENGKISDVWEELIQTAAMCVKVLQHIEPRYNEEKSGQLEIF